MRAFVLTSLTAAVLLLTTSARAQVVAPADETPPVAADPTQPVPTSPTSPTSPASPLPAAAEPDAPPTLPAEPAPTTAEVEAKMPDPPAASVPPPTTAPKKASTTAPPSDERRLGDPVPLTRREPTLKAGSFMGGVRYGLVGNGPTRFINDLRFSFTDNFELRTSLGPWPTALMARGRIGSQQDEFGALVLEGGLAWFDAGVRLQQDTGEASVGARFHFEGSVGWAKAIGDRYALNVYAHYRERISFLDDDGQRAAAIDAHFAGDLLPNLSLSAGLGFATTVGTPVREVVINFVETDRPGISHLLARDEGGEQSLTIPLSLTYGRVDSFDVDLFCTPRVYPEFGILFGAGVRFRLEPLFGEPARSVAIDADDNSAADNNDADNSAAVTTPSKS